MREVMQYAMVMAGWAKNQKKTPMELFQQVQYWWQTLRGLEQAKIEKQALLATVAKMWDLENRSGMAGQSGQRPGQISHELWLKRLQQYPGDKLDLFFDFVDADPVPMQELLGVLFPGGKGSKQAQFERLLEFAGTSCAKSFLRYTAETLTSSQPESEQQLLLDAIETGNLTLAGKWIVNQGGSEQFADQQPLLELILVAKKGYSRCCSGPHHAVPALLCRPLIYRRQMQVSGSKATSARIKAANFAVEKSLVGQRGPKSNQP